MFFGQYNGFGSVARLLDFSTQLHLMIMHLISTVVQELTKKVYLYISKGRGWGGGGWGGGGRRGLERLPHARECNMI